MPQNFFRYACRIWTTKTSTNLDLKSQISHPPIVSNPIGPISHHWALRIVEGDYGFIHRHTQLNSIFATTHSQRKSQALQVDLSSAWGEKSLNCKTFILGTIYFINHHIHNNIITSSPHLIHDLWWDSGWGDVMVMILWCCYVLFLIFDIYDDAYSSKNAMFYYFLGKKADTQPGPIMTSGLWNMQFLLMQRASTLDQRPAAVVCFWTTGGQIKIEVFFPDSKHNLWETSPQTWLLG